MKFFVTDLILQPFTAVKLGWLQKISSDQPNIEILFTKPTKILGVTFLEKNFSSTFLLTKQKSKNFFYTYDPPQKWSVNSKIENLPLIHLRIYKKFSISEPFEEIFVNKVDFRDFGLLVKLPQFWFAKLFLLICFITHVKTKVCKVALTQVTPLNVFILLVASDFKMAATAKPAIRGQKYFGQ